LLWFTLERTAKRRRHQPLLAIFHRTYSVRAFNCVCILIVVMIAILSARAGQSKLALGFLSMSVLLSGVAAFDPGKVAISTRAIVIGYLGWRRALLLESVTNVRIGLFQDGKGELSTVVVVESVSTRPVKLKGFKGSSIALYDSLQDAWRIAKGSESSSPETRSVHSQ
jgi:hypothetical protein